MAQVIKYSIVVKPPFSVITFLKQIFFIYMLKTDTHHYNPELIKMAIGCYSISNVQLGTGIKYLHSVLVLHSFFDWFEDETFQGCVL